MRNVSPIPPVPKPVVLVVDDDEGLLMLLTDTLVREGYAVRQASSGAAAIKELSREKPALMLLDLRLRDMRGQVLLDQLRNRDLLVPFVVITGQGDEKVAVEVMRQGALDYLTKGTALLDMVPGVVARALAGLEREAALASERVERARLEHEVIEISSREQRRIGQDLHDGLGQELTAIEILCAGLKSDVKKDAALAAQVDQISRLLRESIGHVRSLARGLVPVSDSPDSLWSSLVELADRTSHFARVECRLDSPKVVLCPRPEIAVQLHRIAQEAVNNAVKHSGGTRIDLVLAERAGGLELIVRDNGKGGAVRRQDSLGLQVMHHRAAVINATLTVASTAGQGTEVRCFAPLSS